MRKRQAIKIVVEVMGKRSTVRSSGADIWATASGIIRDDWTAAVETVTFEVHYNDGEVFVGHIPPYEKNRDIAHYMRSFCEFYALRRIPPNIEDKEKLKRHIKQAYSRQHEAAIRWLDRYEIGALDRSSVDGEMTPTPMTPSGI